MKPRHTRYLGTLLAVAFTQASQAAIYYWNTSTGSWGTVANLSDNATAAPDGDGQNNLAEFAFDGDPLSATNPPKTFSFLTDSDADVDANKELILSIAVRTGAPAFAASPLSSTIAGINYNVLAPLDLADFSTTVVNVPSTIVTDLPALSSGDYEYRSQPRNLQRTPRQRLPTCHRHTTVISPTLSTFPPCARRQICSPLSPK